MTLPMPAVGPCRSFAEVLMLAALVAPARAQQPSPEQAAAVRQACRSDYTEHCSSAPTGGAAALGCLRQNEAQLAPAFREAVAAIAGTAPPAAAAAPPALGAAGGGMARAGEPPGELFREECGSDVRRLCRGAPPGGGRIIGCLVENREQLSPGCRAAMMELRERR